MNQRKLSNHGTTTIPSRRDDRLVLIYALLYGLVAFLAHLRWFPIGDLGVESDFYAELVVSAQRLMAGDFSIANYPFKGPVYSFLLAGLHLPLQLFGADWYRSAVLLNAIFAATGLLITHRLAKALFGRWIGFATVLGVSLCYEYFLHAHKASSDLVFYVLTIAALTVLLVPESPPARARLFFCGVLAGLAALTRYNGLYLPVAAALVVVLLDPWLQADDCGKPSLSSRLKSAGVLLGGAVVVILPWLVLNFQASGQVFPANNLMNIARESYGGAGAAKAPDGGFTSAVHLVSHDIGHFLQHYMGNITRHLRLDMEGLLTSGLRFFTLAGLFVLIVSRLLVRFIPRLRSSYGISRLQVSLFALSAAYFLVMCVVFHLPRFSLPLLPAYFAAGYGLILGFGANRTPTRFRIVVLVALVAFVSVQQITNLIDGERYYYERRPMWVLEHAEDLRATANSLEARSLMARKPHLAHYASLDYVAYPSALGSVSDLVRHAYEGGADLILVGEDELGGFQEISILHQLTRARGVEPVGDMSPLTLLRLDRKLSVEAAAAIPKIQELRQRLRDNQGSAESVDNFATRYELALAFMVVAEWPAAHDQFIFCLRLAAQYPERLGADDLAYLKVNQAYCLLYLGRYEDGISLLGAKLENLEPTRDRTQQGFRHLVAGRLLAGSDRHEEAWRHFGQAHRIFERLGDETMLAQVQLWSMPSAPVR